MGRCGTESEELKRVEFLPRKREDGKLKGKKKGFLERKIGDCGMNLRSDVSWLKKSNRILSLEDRGALPEEDGNQLRECRAMHEENFLSSWPREDVEERKAEMERLNEEAKQEKSKSGRREVEREGERVEIKRMCLNRVSSGFFENFSPHG